MHPQQQRGHLQYSYNRDGALIATLMRSHYCAFPVYIALMTVTDAPTTTVWARDTRERTSREGIRY